MNTNPTMDPAALERLRDLGGDEFVRQMVALYLELAARKLAEARAGLQAGDFKTVRMAVHPLRSSSGNVGARLMMELAARIDNLAVAQDFAAIPLLFAQLEAEFGRVRPLLEMHSRPPSP